MKHNSSVRTITIGSLLLAGLFFVQCGSGKDDKQAKAQQPVEAPGPDPATIAEGKQLFNTNGCQVCHGETGKGDGPGGASLNPPPRNFSRGSDYKNGSSQEEIAQTIMTGIPPLMAAYPHINEEDRMKIAAFIVSLQK